MNLFLDLFTNKIFLAPASAWFVAQVLKVIINTVKSGFEKERMIGGGGMPSTHSATVTGLIIITGLTYGLAGFEFAMALFFGIVVIYDARGVRYEAQRMGKALNNLNDERKEEGKQPLDIKRFKEQLGHNVLEIIVGIIIGLIAAIIVYNLPF
ncbi:MAG: divergent PAP2 family protein [Pseudobutyrivibrio sp.]|nr:divergent PAP2 family protein [Pseudobutyrivibrio sp.]